jgi:hypothetical protein
VTDDDNGSFDPLPPNTNNPFHHISEYDAIDWGGLDGAKHQIMRQAALYGILGVAHHCIMYHEPMLALMGNTLSVYCVDSGEKCGLYTKVDFHFTDEEMQNEEFTVGPANVFTWVMTAMMDEDTSKQLGYPAIIEGKRARVEIG